MDAARSLFNLFEQQGEDLINRMVKEGEQESLILDFKSARNESAPMQEDDRKTLAEAISGFSNSDGGLIVWGVDCRSGPTRDDPDQAQAVKPIKNLSRWLSDLNQYTHQVVSPEVVGVEHKLILKYGETDIGYAVTYVPKCNSQPIMAIAKKKEQYCYFIRSGSSFVKMESFMVSDRYQRRPQPKLEISWNIVRLSSTGSTENTISIKIGIILGIKNNSLGIAIYPAIKIYENESFELDRYGLDGNGRTGLPERLTLRSGDMDKPRFLLVTLMMLSIQVPY